MHDSPMLKEILLLLKFEYPPPEANIKGVICWEYAIKEKLKIVNRLVSSLSTILWLKVLIFSNV